MDGTATPKTGVSDPGGRDMPPPGNPHRGASPPEQAVRERGEEIGLIDIARIMHAIPHRFPFLMIDRVVEVVRDRSAIGIKNVSINEFFFQGHFPNHPVMPGVLIIESMAQTAAVLVVETLGTDAAGRGVYC